MKLNEYILKLEEYKLELIKEYRTSWRMDRTYAANLFGRITELAEIIENLYKIESE